MSVAGHQGPHTQSNDWHPGITLHRLKVGSGVAGFIFSVGRGTCISLILTLAIACGAVVAFVLARQPERTPVSHK